MKRILLLLLFPTLLLAQTGTQHDRIDVRGQVKTDKFINRATIIITGATPDVSNGNVFKTNNPGIVTVTNFLNGADTQLITVNCGDANTTIQNNANIVNTSGTDFVCGVNKTISYIYDAAQVKWIQSGTGSGGGGGGGGGSPAAPGNCIQKNNGAGAFGCSAESSDGTTFVISEDLQPKGPNPNWNLLAFGGVASSASMVCSISSGTTALSCVSNPDFANGQGVVVPLAGPATANATPATPIPTPINLLNGVTSYNYQIIAEDKTGGLTAASGTGTTSTGAATLGLNTITLTSCVITNGIATNASVATYTSSGNHNLQVGAQVDIEGFGTGNAGSCTGVVTVATTPTGTTFTVNKGAVAAMTDSTGTPTAKVWACNELTYAAGSYTPSAIRYWIYRGAALVGVAPGIDPHFIDCGVSVTGAPAYVPATPPGSPQPGYLATTIASGGGTTSLTLTNPASNTATTQTVLHDNSVNLKNAAQAVYTNGGGTVAIPDAGGNTFQFNSLLDFTTGLSGVSQSSLRIHFNGLATINQPWWLRSSMDLEGEPKSSTSLQYVQATVITGNAHPMFYSAEAQANGVHFSRLRLNVIRAQQSGIYWDEGGDGGASVGLVLDDVYLTGQAGKSKPIIVKGGFGFYWNRGVCDTGSPGLQPWTCAAFSRVSTAVTPTGQILGLVKIKDVNLSASFLEIDCRGSTFNMLAGEYTFANILFENVTMPLIKTTGCGGLLIPQVALQKVDLADNTNGCSTPIIDSTTGGITSVYATDVAPGCGAPPTFITSTGSTSASGLFVGSNSSNPGNLTPNTNIFQVYGGGALGSFNGRFFTPLTVAAAPSLALSAGGGVSIGSQCYSISAVDIDGFESIPGPVACITVTGGNQTVTVTPPTLPSGSTGYRPYRGGLAPSTQQRVNLNSFGGCGAVVGAGVNYVDTFGFVCGNSTTSTSYAGQSAVSASGIATPSFRLMTNGFTTTVSGDNVANRTVAYPAASGTVCLTAACVVNGVTINGDAALTSSPRAVPPVFFPGALTTTWTGASWTLDKAITVTRVQSAAKVAPAGCSTSAIVRVTDGSTPINLTINAATNDSGTITQSYAAGATLTVGVTTAAAGCTTSPGDLNVSIQSRMQ